MAELVECARLEIVYTGDRIEGSNPPISAIKIKKPEWAVLFLYRYGRFRIIGNACCRLGSKTSRFHK